MRIAAFKVFKFKLPLRYPLIVGKHRVTDRTGLIIELQDENYHAALGEISPLPGFSQEDITQVEEELAKLRASVVDRDLPNDLDSLSGGFERWLGDYDLTPSVRFGFETAVLDLLARTRNIPLCKLISDTPLDYVSINGLLTGSRDAIMKKADKLLETGYRAFKLKVGRDSVQEDIQIIRDVRQLIKDDSILRLDANRAWDIDQAVAFADALADVMIDYIEEPVKTLPLLRRLMDEIGLSLPVALDESLMELTPQELLSLSAIKAVVLKPTLLGFERAIHFARSARPLGITPVVSASFESGIGLGVLAHIAAAVHVEDVAAGLDTLDRFAEDLLSRPLSVTTGRLQVPALPQAVEALNRHFLQTTHDE